jgi:hypothetical protein
LFFSYFFFVAPGISNGDFGRAGELVNFGCNSGIIFILFLLELDLFITPTLEKVFPFFVKLSPSEEIFGGFEIGGGGERGSGG